MTEQAQRTPSSTKPETPTTPPPLSWRQRLTAWIAQRSGPRVLAVLLGVSLILNAATLAYLRLHVPPTVTQSSSPEIQLGVFEFRGPDAPVRGAKFSLWVSLLDGVDKAAREHLITCRHRVEQAIEELLRTAHSGDFEDPTLSGLKRQMQEQINGVLGIRGVGEVIITNLVLERNWQPTEGKGQTAESATSPETPPG